MKKKINRRKIFYFSKKKIIYLFYFLSLLTILAITFYNKLVIYENIKRSVENFSEKFNYQYVNLNINGINNVSKEFIELKVQKYIRNQVLFQQVMAQDYLQLMLLKNFPIIQKRRKKD